MRKNPLSNMSARGGIITSEFLEIVRSEKVVNSRVLPESFASYGAVAPVDKRELDRRLVESWDHLRERWDAVSSRYLKMNVSDARSRWMLPLFRELGFDPVFNREDIVVDGDEKLRFRLSHKGWNSLDAPMVHMVAPAQDLEGEPLEREDEVSRRGRKRSPHDELQAFLNVNKRCKWGIVTNGVLLRVLREYYHTTTKGYVEFDLENIFRERSFTDFRALYRMVHASRFIPDKEGVCPLEQFYKESVAAGVTVGENLRRNVKRAIESLGNGFMTPELAEKMVDDEELCKAYYSELLRLVYRLLFLLFAEQRAMLPTRDSLYAEEYSITRLREMAETRRGKDEHLDLWEGLKVTFQMLKNGCPPVRVFGYNGSLFDDSEIPFLSTLSCKNEDVLATVRHLTLVEEEKVLKRINYLDLGVEEIGSIYESLLDFTPRVFATEQEVEGEKVSANTFFLDPRGAARKTTGSYYTHPRLVDELIKSALKPVVDDRLAKASDKERALLSVKVCDPACGSGAFLIAANNYMARELAKLRTGQVEPPDREVRKARRDVLQHCIYGVDLNPMAAELAKVSLWINSCVEDMPLNFLDHHIKCGNSLIGATPELIRNGIPDEAFTPVEGDDKDFANNVKKRNSFGRTQRLMDEYKDLQQARRATEYARLDDFMEISPSDVEEKKRKYAGLVSSSDWKAQKFLADTWTAAFFWSLSKGNPFPPTQAVFRTIQNNGSHKADSKTPAIVEELAQLYHFFHWHLEFPDIFRSERGGFDCVLGNPPWEKVKLQEREFFAAYDQSIVKAPTAAIRKQLIENLKRTNHQLHTRFSRQLRIDSTTNKFIHKSRRFPLTGKGDINTYAVFAELASDIIGYGGRFGLVLRTGIITDDTTKDFFSKILLERRIVSVYDFINTNKIFAGIDPTERFCLLTCTTPGNGPAEFEMSTYNVDFNDLDNRNKVYSMSRGTIAKLNPNTLTSTLFEYPKDVEVCKRIYSNNSILIHEHDSGETNDWGIEYFGMFHMTNDSRLFRDKEWLEKNGYGKLEDGSYKRGQDTYLRLYEAKLFDMFDHRFGTFEGVPREKRFGIKANPKEPTIEQKKNPYYEVESRYYVNAKDVWRIYEMKNIPKDIIFVFRNACRPYAELRTARGTLIPACAASNGCPLLIFRDSDDSERAKRLIEFTCIFNSIVFDYLVRQKMSTGNLNKFILIQIAIPRPESFQHLFEFEDKIKTARDFISENASTLLFTTESFKYFFSRLGINEPFLWDEEKRFESQCFCDALIAHLYGIEKDDFEHILGRFPLLASHEIRLFGEYKTKELCLHYYERIKRTNPTGNIMIER